MAQEMNDQDLPDPEPRRYISEKDYRNHRWKLVLTILGAAVIYSTLHKLLVPFFLAHTAILNLSYAHVDYWFIPAWILFLWLTRKSSIGVVGSFLAGLLICYAAWDVYLIFSGSYPGWLQWSHALSSLPLGLGSIFVMTFPDRDRRLGVAWLGAALCAVGMLWFPHRVLPREALVRKTPAPVDLSQADLQVLASESCGQSHFRVEMESDWPWASKHNIVLGECGFSPQVMRLDSDTVTVQSHLQGTLNIHSVYYSFEGQKTRQKNRILKAQEVVALNQFALKEQEAFVLIFSDARPEMGISVLLSPHLKARVREIRVGEGRQVQLIPRESP